MEKIDILSIGDIATDAFIKIKNADAICDKSGDHCKLCLNYGGKIPYESVEVYNATGNSANVAISASRLGLKSALMSNIGGDKYGDDCIDILKKENVDIRFTKRENDKITNYHYVLCYDKERTILVKHEKYNYEWMNKKELEDYCIPSYLYLSSLGEDSLEFHNQILTFLNENKEIKFVFQPGTFQIKMGEELLNNIYKRTDIFLSNKEEAKTILKIKEEELGLTISNLLKKIYELGPKIVIITDGIDGAYSYDGNEILFMKALIKNPVENTGAGDAFSSAFISGLFLGKSISESLIWGALNASSVVSYIGPQKGLLTIEQIKESLETLPDDSKPTKIN